MKIWVVNFKAPTTAFVKRTKKHDYAVHAVDINEFYIASGSVDHTIKVYNVTRHILDICLAHTCAVCMPVQTAWVEH